jgi:hypothetical protein
LGGAEAEIRSYSSGCYVFGLSLETDVTPAMDKIEERLGIGGNKWSGSVFSNAVCSISSREEI